MSIEATKAVWRTEIRPASDKLVLLAFADMKNEKTGQLNPSIRLLAERAGLSRSQTQRVVHRLMAAGYLSVVGNELGGAPGKSRHYKIHLAALDGSPSKSRLDTGRMDATGSAHETGRTGAHHGSHRHIEGAASMHLTGSVNAAQIGMNQKEMEVNHADYRISRDGIAGGADVKLQARAERVGGPGSVMSRAQAVPPVGVASGGAQATAAWPQTRSEVEAIGERLGLGRWDESAFSVGRGELFQEYERRVHSAAQQGHL